MSSPPRRGHSGRKEFFVPRPPRANSPADKKSSKSPSSAAEMPEAPPPIIAQQAPGRTKAKGRSRSASQPSEALHDAVSPTRAEQQNPVIAGVSPPEDARPQPIRLASDLLPADANLPEDSIAEPLRVRKSRKSRQLATAEITIDGSFSAELEAQLGGYGANPFHEAPHVEVESYREFMAPPARAAKKRSSKTALRQARVIPSYPLDLVHDAAAPEEGTRADQKKRAKEEKLRAKEAAPPAALLQSPLNQRFNPSPSPSVSPSGGSESSVDHDVIFASQRISIRTGGHNEKGREGCLFTAMSASLWHILWRDPQAFGLDEVRANAP